MSSRNLLFTGDAPPVYTYQTNAASQAEIDLDLKLIEHLLSLNSLEDAKSAYNVYVEGSSSWPYAELHLSEELSVDLKKGVPVTGLTADQKPLTGFLLEHTREGANVLKVQYDVSDIHDPHQCLVGGNPHPSEEGCFVTKGAVHIEGVDHAVHYEYDKLKDNKNYRTLQNFSALAHNKMKACGKCAYVQDFQAAVDYYGSTNYADQWITSAFYAQATPSLTSGTGNFTAVSYSARAIAIERGAAFLSTSMFVIREMEDAIWKCMSDCDDHRCTDPSMHLLDSAVAFYTGSLVESAGSDQGKLLYSLADNTCRDFKTCGVKGNAGRGPASVNFRVYEEFNQMQQDIMEENCPALRHSKNKVVKQMLVPMVQATLRSSFHRDNDGVDDKELAEGATFAAALLPYVHQCSHQSARKLYDNMSTDAKTTSFVDVKSTLEGQYACLGITCEDVGGYWGTVGYRAGASPCVTPKVDDGSDIQRHLHIGAITMATIALSIYLYGRRKLYLRNKRLARYDLENDLSDSDSEGEFVFS